MAKPRHVHITSEVCLSGREVRAFVSLTADDARAKWDKKLDLLALQREPPKDRTDRLRRLFRELMIEVQTRAEGMRLRIDIEELHPVADALAANAEILLKNATLGARDDMDA